MKDRDRLIDWVLIVTLFVVLFACGGFSQPAAEAQGEETIEVGEGESCGFNCTIRYVIIGDEARCVVIDFAGGALQCAFADR